MKVQSFPIESITPYQRNAKTHPKEQIERIARQIHEVGFLVPIVVDRDKVVVSGHGRLLAAKSLGLKEVPVVVAEHLTEDQAMAWRIADNKVAESPWDMSLLAFDMQTLELHGVDLTVTAFSMDDAKAIVASLSGADLPADGPPKEGSKELGEESFQDFQHKCPRCGFEYDDSASS